MQVLATEGPEVVAVLERVTPERDVSRDVSTGRIPLNVGAVEVVFGGDSLEVLNAEELQHTVEISETSNQDVFAGW